MVKVYEFILPTHLTLARKRGRNKRIGLSLNWLRNAHYRQSNECKKLFKRIVTPMIREQMPKRIQPPISITYELFPARRCDIANFTAVIDKFFQDALVDLGRIPGDDCRYVTDVISTYGQISKDNPRCECRVREI